MSEILLRIDGKEAAAREGMTILEAAQKAGIAIPTLCHHEKLEPYGGCRLCTVEVEAAGRSKLVAACLYPVEKDLVVRTRSEKVDRIRKMILELLLAHAPDAFELQDLAKEYGADRDLFEKEASFCIHCGLCVRYCAEVKKKERPGIRRQGNKAGDKFHPGDSLEGMLELQTMFPALPNRSAPGGLRSDRSTDIRPAFQTRVGGIGKFSGRP